MMDTVPPTTLRGSTAYEALRDRGRRAAESGRLEEALGLYERAVSHALEEEREDLADLARLNRSAVLITLGRQDEVMEPLRQMLMRSTVAELALLAAYNLSRAHVRDKAYKKALFYARIVRDRAEATDDRYWRVVSLNQVANCLVDESHFREAAVEYERALAVVGEEPSVARALPLLNLGYCLIMLGRPRRGMACSLRALRWLRRFSARVYEVWPEMDLCYGYLELGRHDRARQHGRRALALAEESGDPDRIKTSLYLLGETEREAGDEAAAEACFSELQQRFYPDMAAMVALMVAVGMRKVINLRG